MEEGDGSGQFVKAELRPKITIARGGDSALALALHEEAHRLCFIARSVNFPVDVEAEIDEE
jgi:organic hydroperoxide reductase OsmC/OhrA